MTEEEKKKRKRAVILAESKPDDSGNRDKSFITEGENMRAFYAKNNPDVDIEIVPVYGKSEWESAKERLKGVEDVYLFGHSGSRLMDIPHEEIANTLKDSGAKNCSIGSCSFEEYSKHYKGIQNVKYRGKENWYGVWPNAKDVDSAMFAKAFDHNAGPNDQLVNVFKPVQGVHFNRIFNRPKEEAVPVPVRPNPAFFK